MIIYFLKKQPAKIQNSLLKIIGIKLIKQKTTNSENLDSSIFSV